METLQYKSYKNIPYKSIYLECDQDQENKSLALETEESVLQQSKFKLMSKEFDMGLTLAGISLMFVLCQSVKLVPDVYELMVCDHFKIAQGEHDENCINTKKIDFVTSLGNLFVCINSAANFLLYMVRGKKFRDLFCQTYCPCLKKPSRNSNNFTMTTRFSSASNSVYQRKHLVKNEINQ